MGISRVLIVDDSPTIRSALTKQLEKLRVVVTQAPDGVEGLRIARSSNVDLVITDIDMPRMDGFELCERLKKSPETRSIPVIILSSSEDERSIERGFKVGAAAYVAKARASTELQDRIQQVFDMGAMLQSRSLLIVDDSNFIRQMLTENFLQASFQVMAASNGKEALELLRHRKPDLILSDLDMPEMDGYTFCKIVHSDKGLSNIPFIVMSTVSDRSLMRRMIQSGASGFLVKPFNVDQVVITIEKFLSDHFQMVIKEKERLSMERSLILGSISSLINALEARDRYTRGHSEAVASIVVGMARRIGLDLGEIEKLEIAGKLHDLGKIGIPDKILLKPMQLTYDEYEVIKTHPVLGAEILSPIPSLSDIVPVVASHHERFDGKGYPEGLKGAEIPLWARMITVADTFHALISDRPYRKALHRDVALQIITDSKDTQLCPDCVRTFLEWVEQSAS